MASPLALVPLTAQALTINVTYDSTITGRANAAAIETAFEAVVQSFEAAIANPITINLHVAWGRVNTTAMAANNVGETRVSAAGGFRTFSQARDFLLNGGVTTTLPTVDPTGTNRFLIPTAQAKALGMTGFTVPAYDAYIGFSSTYAFRQFDNSIAPALTYDFVGTAQHELEHALGRVSGLISNTPIYAYAADMYRYTAPDTNSFSYSAAAYASVDGGDTKLGTYNNSGTGGDRVDWLASTGSDNAQSAHLVTGREYCLSTADQRLMTGLGYTFTASAASLYKAGDDCAPFGADDAAVTGIVLPLLTSDLPEPTSALLLLSGLSTALLLRRRSRTQACGDIAER